MKRYILAIFALVALSCTKDFEKINTNPNTPTEGQIKSYNLVEPLLYGISRTAQYYAYNFNNEIAQTSTHTATVGSSIHQYLISESHFQGVWNNFARYGFDAHHMNEVASRDGDAFLEGVGLVMKVFSLSNLTFLYGDIPYEEAFQGKQGNVTPKFNTQVEVVDLMLADLEKANQIFAKSPKPMKAGLDPIYGDSAVQWRKFANSLKIRILCRMSGLSGYWERIQEIIDNPSQYPLMASDADNATCTFQAVDPYKSYWGDKVYPDADFVKNRLSAQLVKMTVLQDSGHAIQAQDPRLVCWGVRRGDFWSGSRSGCANQVLVLEDETASNQNAAVLNNSITPAFLMDWCELLFVYAEGAMKGKLHLTKDWKDLYADALRASCAKWASVGKTASVPVFIQDADIAAWMESPLASLSLAGTDGCPYGSQEEMLFAQKYLANHYVLFEQFNEWRRTEYPILTVGEGAVFNDHELPTRFVYPNYTRLSNEVNVNKALARMGGSNDMHLALDWSYKALTGGSHRNPYKAE